ncbi:c-type cytochrome [Christiangramia forsetii]|nr:hypothetical protein [Christiangramia forsetii]
MFIKECSVCPCENGKGQRLANSAEGYQYPPLWGPDSYNNGAGMHRVITAAQFIKGNMPFGQATWDNPKLTYEEAYHLAGYINSFERPEKRSLEKDYPDLKLKPVSNPYGPWADHFSATQHKYGPYPPIMDYYQREYGITKKQMIRFLFFFYYYSLIPDSQFDFPGSYRRKKAQFSLRSVTILLYEHL